MITVKPLQPGGWVPYEKHSEDWGRRIERNESSKEGKWRVYWQGDTSKPVRTREEARRLVRLLKGNE